MPTGRLPIELSGTYASFETELDYHPAVASGLLSIRPEAAATTTFIRADATSAYLPLVTSTNPSQQTEFSGSAFASNYLHLVTSTTPSHQTGAFESALDDFRTIFPGTPSLSNHRIISGSSPRVSRITGSGRVAPSIQTGVVDGMPYKIDNGVLYIDGATFSTATPTSATLHHGEILKIDPNGAISLQLPSTNTSGSGPNGPVREVRRIGVTPRQYFIGAFLPTIVAVFFAIPWYLLASALQEMEPFFQLQRPEGTPASNSILLDYQHTISVIATLNAMTRGHFLVWGSGLISIAVSLLAPLAPETVYIGFVGQGVCTATSGRLACTPRLGVHLITARVVQGILVFIAALTLALIIAISRKRSGVYSNPLSIASAATILQDQNLIDEVRQLDPYTMDPNILKTALQGQRYRIGSYEDAHGRQSYGLMICDSSAASHETDGCTQKHRGKKYISIFGSSAEEDTSVQPKANARMLSADLLTQPVGVAVYALLVVALEVVVIYYNWTGGDTGFQRFMESQSFGVTFLFTALGVGIKMYWTLLDDGKSFLDAKS